MHDDLYEHTHLSDSDRAEMAQYIWRQETVEMNTVGIDIGSSTSHLLFAKIVLQRQSQGLSSRFVVIERKIVAESPIMLTPFLANGTINAAALEEFIHKAYADAGLQRSDIDSGAVILTGEAIKRKNAKAIDELFAEEAGKFVCATAGHKLECTLAAHGSGAVRLSKERAECTLHVDIGGGTTKLALIDEGRIVGVSAFAVGGRLLARDAGGKWTRVDDSARLVAEEMGLPTDPQSLADVKVRRKVAERLAQIAMDHILGSPLDRLGAALLLTEPLDRSVTPEAVSISGGVSEYIFGREDKEFGDIAKLLAQALRQQMAKRMKIHVLDPGHGIRATVIGASQFTVQVSGKTIHLPDPGVLPVHNVPVVRLELGNSERLSAKRLSRVILDGVKRVDLNPNSRMALAFTWNEEPHYSALAAVGRAIARALAPEGRREQLLLLMIDGDIGKTLGRIISKEHGLTHNLVSIDGVQLQELDYVDVGELVDPPGVVPVVIKSLLFS
jgi:ethanolamine utilization protein EutA